MITFVKIRGFLSFPMKHLWTEYIVPILWGMGIFLALVALWAGMKILVLGYFPVPTSSMRPSIVPGDVVFVNKLRLGPRTFRNLDFLDSDTIPVENIRLPGYGEIERNDVIVFNYPYAVSWSKARFNYKAFYVKRCLGLPGDTLSIVNGFYKVAGCDLPLGNLRDQKRLSRTPLENLPLSISRADRPNGWTIKDFGPLYIPREGDTIVVDERNYEFYKRLIEWETGGEMTASKGKYCLDGHPVDRYVVKNDYYFVAGDNLFDSRDSRYWGLLQQEYIVGVVPFVLYSKDRNGGGVRWDRFFKSLDL